MSYASEETPQPAILAYAYDASADDQGLAMAPQALMDDGTVQVYSRAFDQKGVEILPPDVDTDCYHPMTLEKFREKFGKCKSYIEKEVSDLRIVVLNNEFINLEKHAGWKLKVV